MLALDVIRTLGLNVALARLAQISRHQNQELAETKGQLLIGNIAGPNLTTPTCSSLVLIEEKLVLCVLRGHVQI